MPTNPSPSVDLARLTDELESLFEGTTAYVNRRTGAVVKVMDTDLLAVEEGEEDFEPEGGDDELVLLQAIVESGDWVAMPDKFEIHEWQIMSDFADSRGGRAGDELAGAIRGRGAFRMFRDVIDRHGLHDAWFAFRREAIERIAVRALEAESIPYQRLPVPSRSGDLRRS
jgi:hypothetical protein